MNVILIPAYKPSIDFVDLIKELNNAGFKDIVVVNDGNGLEFKHIFDKVIEHGAHVVVHITNLGKGRALKSGFNYIFQNFPNARGVVTADADGQHLVEDIQKVSKELEQSSNKMVLGTRNFSYHNTPLRSFIGNSITRYIFFFLVGYKLDDTQTGLRGVLLTFIPTFMKLSGEKYEYETNMLLACKEQGIQIQQVQIKTVYIENNRSSHFNPLFDSMKIYFLLIRFIFSSVIAYGVDIVLFAILYPIIGLSYTMIVARVCASVVNFTLNKKVVFHSQTNVKKLLIRYYLFLAAMTFVAMNLISFVQDRFMLSALLAKVSVETALFLFNFAFQREFIFTENKRR